MLLKSSASGIKRLMKRSISETLEFLGVTSAETKVVYSDRTRDNENLKVWKDTGSGVIYIDDFYTGDEEYISGEFRRGIVANFGTGKRNFERDADMRRRFSENLQHVAGKDCLDFGCGGGEFLEAVESHCESVTGVELEESYLEQLAGKGIRALADLSQVENRSIDTIVSFHVIEHLPDPISVLADLKSKLRVGGVIIVEVPHAKDFLLSKVNCDAFKNFTLWSQHLVLHTRESLEKLLLCSGFTDVTIRGVQRFPLSNHIQWLSAGKPGGHKSQLSMIDSPDLHYAYAGALAALDVTDTLVAVARVES